MKPDSSPFAMSSASDPLSQDGPTKTRAQRILGFLVSDDGTRLEGLISGSGTALLHSYLAYLIQSYGLRLAVFGELVGQDLDRLRTIAVEGPSGALPDFEYSLAKTPCQQVFDQKTCFYPSRAQEFFPEDRVLRDLGIESYLGVSLHDRASRPLGLVAVVSASPMPDEVAIEIRETLALFLPRAIAELEHRRLLSDMERILEAEEAVRPDRLGQLARALAKSLQVKAAFVVRILPEDSSRFESLALSVEGVSMPGSERTREGTPFENMDHQASYFVGSGIRALYPEDEFLVELEAESYY